MAVPDVLQSSRSTLTIPVLIVVAACTASAAPQPAPSSTATPDPIGKGDCIRVSGRDDDVEYTPTPCTQRDHPDVYLVVETVHGDLGELGAAGHCHSDAILWLTTIHGDGGYDVDSKFCLDD